VLPRAVSLRVFLSALVFLANGGLVGYVARPLLQEALAVALLKWHHSSSAPGRCGRSSRNWATYQQWLAVLPT
jgi:hypothetical protein